MSDSLHTAFRWHEDAHVYDARGGPVRPDATASANVLNLPETPVAFALATLFGGGCVANEFCVHPLDAPSVTPLPALPVAALHCLSSGSTGAPRRIRRTQQSWINSFGVNARQWQMTPADSYALLGALSHSLSLYAAMEALWIGADLHLLADLRPDRKLARLAAGGISVLYATPAQIGQLVEAATRRKVPPLADLRLLLVGGGPFDDDAQRAAAALFPKADIRAFYGASETSFVTITDATTPNGSVGGPYPSVLVELRDASGQKLPAGEIGEVWVSSPYLFDGYIGGDNPETRRDGAFLTVGELGMLDGAGNLTLKGRRSRMVTIADQNVFAEAVEAALMQLDGIRRAAVFARPDAKRGTVLVAAVDLEAGAPAPDHLLSCARDALGPLKAPRMMHVITDWPVLASGKTDLVRLDAQMNGATP